MSFATRNGAPPPPTASKAASVFAVAAETGAAVAQYAGQLGADASSTADAAAPALRSGVLAVAFSRSAVGYGSSGKAGYGSLAAWE
eukprot:gene10558-386_t